VAFFQFDGDSATGLQVAPELPLGSTL
jgi:hypothetical protein